MPCEDIHVQYTFRVPEDDGHYLPSSERGFRFFGFRRSRVKALHWRTFAIKRGAMHPRLVHCHDRIQKNSPSCSYRDCTTCSSVHLCFSVNKCRINRVHTFEYWRCSLMNVFTQPSLMFSTQDNSLTVTHLFSWMRASMRSLFSSVIKVLGWCSLFPFLF